MEFPLVSIIVPMYNTAGCIARCVKSICAQTYKSIEILLLNDGSTDDTLAVCRALAASDHRIALVDKNNTYKELCIQLGVYDKFRLRLHGIYLSLFESPLPNGPVQKLSDAFARTHSRI